MAPTTEPRRSSRLAKKAETNARTQVQKPTRRSPRNLPQKKKISWIDLEQVEAQLAKRNNPQRHRVVTSIERTQQQRPQIIKDVSYSEDSEDATEIDSEDEFSMEDDSPESEDEFNENANGSHDHTIYINSYDLQNIPGRKYSAQSYDSRLEDGNEQYEQDDFLVDDAESVVMEHSEDDDHSECDSDEDDDDLEIKMEREPFRVGYRPIGRPHRACSIFSDTDWRRRYSTPISPKTVRVTRQLSDVSYSRRRSSSLFVSDLVGDASIRQRFVPELPTSEKEVEDEDEVPFISQASEEIVEEIIDAIALFSRRVYRDRPHLRLRLAAAVLEDREIRDALEYAIRTGLGRKISLIDGSKRLSIGPKVR